MSYELSNIINSIINADCYEVLKQLPDKSVDLVLTDPPYGINWNCDYASWTKPSKKAQGGKSHRSYKQIIGDDQPFNPIPWLRVSKNQIMWGANCYNELLPSGSILVWYKRKSNFLAQAEIAWCSIGLGSYVYDYPVESIQNERTHPTQKPVPLFKWCLTKYSKPGDLILDPYCGSGTTALACHALGRRYICIDKESDYVEAARKRLLQFQAQGDLFAGENSALAEENQTSTQQSLYASAEYRLRATPH